MWHFMTRTDPPLTLLLWLKHRMRTDYEHLHRYVHKWHSSIKHFSTMRVWIRLTFQMNFYPFLSWNEEILIPFWPNTHTTHKAQKALSLKSTISSFQHTLRKPKQFRWEKNLFPLVLSLTSQNTFFLAEDGGIRKLLEPWKKPTL